MYTYICAYIHTHMHIHTTHTYIYRGEGLTFLPISQSEGPTKAPDALYFDGGGSWPCGMSGSSLKIISILPGGICVQIQRRAGLALLWGPGRDETCQFVPSPFLLSTSNL